LTAKPTTPSETFHSTNARDGAEKSLSVQQQVSGKKLHQQHHYIYSLTTTTVIVVAAVVDVVDVITVVAVVTALTVITLHNSSCVF